mmetsp:Transcript_38503/g.114344  ORF Transcript_38503/g.114344 Transcript_38503/m.114344 type:complete len:217 (-) Transcript_38503:157-807(-)
MLLRALAPGGVPLRHARAHHGAHEVREGPHQLGAVHSAHRAHRSVPICRGLGRHRERLPRHDLRNLLVTAVVAPLVELHERDKLLPVRVDLRDVQHGLRELEAAQLEGLDMRQRDSRSLANPSVDPEGWLADVASLRDEVLIRHHLAVLGVLGDKIPVLLSDLRVRANVVLEGALHDPIHVCAAAIAEEQLPVHKHRLHGHGVVADVVEGGEAGVG